MRSSRLMGVIAALVLVTSFATYLLADVIEADKTCYINACNNIPTHYIATCPGTLKRCKFDQSAGSVIYCAGDSGTCTVIGPIEPNNCAGYCEDAPSQTCRTPELNKCRNPIQLPNP